MGPAGNREAALRISSQENLLGGRAILFMARLLRWCY